MDSVTLVALIGVAGTALAAVAGAFGAGLTARIGARAQSALEDRKSRRDIYGACASAFLVQHDAMQRLTESLMESHLDVDRAAEKLLQAQAAHDEIGLKVGAVLVEGPMEVAISAQETAGKLREWLDELEWQLKQERPRGKDARISAVSLSAISKFGLYSGLCRAALHPRESRVGRFRFLKRRRLLRSFEKIHRFADNPRGSRE
ncbi:hypothetical protein OG266_22720 [Streptomyces sp. NBC_00554]|uniref:hypothetical protein n=1 Tax=Streptomyces sp. NBC_00554 TaxID=2903661 RepID=UPI00352C01C4|nr:hypothetical protein OG266_22720 [Streptomyces sp. NBC_00554]